MNTLGRIYSILIKILAWMNELKTNFSKKSIKSGSPGTAPWGFHSAVLGLF